MAREVNGDRSPSTKQMLKSLRHRKGRKANLVCSRATWCFVDQSSMLPTSATDLTELSADADVDFRRPSHSSSRAPGPASTAAPRRRMRRQAEEEIRCARPRIEPWADRTVFLIRNRTCYADLMSAWWSETAARGRLARTLRAMWRPSNCGTVDVSFL